MGPNSLARRVVKKLIYPVMNEDAYAVVQAVSKAWDIGVAGGYPEPELDLVPLAVRPGDTVVDVGANYGYYAHPLSRAVGPRGRVFAFEPVAFTMRSLRIVAALLRMHNVEMIEKGCSDRSGQATFEVPVQANGALSAGLAYLRGRNEDRPGRETQVRWQGTRAVTVDLVRLDDALPPIDDLAFLKADIEGQEVFAFRGASATFQRHRPTVLCEINPWYLEGFGLKVDDLAGPFFAGGYGLYRYVEGKLRPVAPSAVTEGNYVFLHPSRADRLRDVLT